jgi:hypothetical protein
MYDNPAAAYFSHVMVIIALALLFGAGMLLHDVFKDSLTYFR